MTAVGGAIGVGLVWGRLAHLAGRRAGRPLATWSAVGVSTCLVAAMAWLAAEGAGLAGFATAFGVSLVVWILVDAASYRAWGA
jgi:hypothetical protein